MFYLFLTFLIVSVLAILFFIFFPIIYKRYLNKFFLNVYGKKAYQIANKYDYYLINKLTLEANDNTKIQIDHLLFGDKYLYVIHDCYYDGAIEYKENDRNWIFYYGKAKRPNKRFTENHIITNKNLISKLSMITGLDKSLMINVVLINNSCIVNEFKTDSSDVAFLKVKSLKDFILELEGRDIKPLDKEQLRYVVHDLARLNLKP
ncbi:MAG: NERD domain-containing protein [Bacilli bacterium]|nr:NERD domain-containing protein [Bacilli bacterium]